MRLVAWQCSLMAATCPAVGQAQWAHSHLHMHLLLKCLLCSEAFGLSAALSEVLLSEDGLREQGAPGTAALGGSPSFSFFTAKGLRFLDRPKC